MRNIKIVLLILILFGLNSACFADTADSFKDREKSINSKSVLQGSFANQLQNNKSYNSATYNMPKYTNYIQDNPAIGATMGGLMNAINMGTGYDNSYSQEMLKRQEEEYTRQQIKYAQEDQAEDYAQDAPKPKPKASKESLQDRDDSFQEGAFW